MSRTPIIAGNWKMNLTPDEGAALAGALAAEFGAAASPEVLLFPTALAVPPVIGAVKGSAIGVGVQNVHAETSGAFTGEISVEMAHAAGCGWVLIGHSERRSLFGESDQDVRAKLEAVQRVGLKAVICVGETLDEREAGTTNDVLKRQVSAALEGLPERAFDSIVIAYEPVWAIGTGKTATPDIAQAAHAFIRETVAGLNGEEAAAGLRILYGGSVKPGNVNELMAEPDIDGALVGGASLKAESFLPIIRYNA